MILSLEFILKTNDGTKKMVDDCLQLVKDNEKIIIFGAGVGGRNLYELLEKYSLQTKIIAFSDNNLLKHGKLYQRQDLYVIPPNKLLEKYSKNIKIIIASSAYPEIKKQLVNYGFESNNIYLFNFAFMDLNYTDKDFIWDHLNDFDRAYKRMQDEKSRVIFTNILNYRITKDEVFLKDMQNYIDNESFQYFDSDLFKFEKDEIFLDVGAYIGDTLKNFDNIYKNNWEKYYGIEADPKIYKQLKKNIKTSSYFSRVSLFNLAAWNESRELYFESSAGNSKMEINDNNEEKIRADCIDNILPKEKISFVKMDIEGSEYMALLGMKKLIKRNKPILAICVYHKREDFFKLTDLIEKICPNEYTFYLRQYRYTPTETVCYAIPLNRVINS